MAESIFVTGVANGETQFGAMSTVDPMSTPLSLSVSPLQPILSDFMPTVQLTVTATLTDGSQINVTAPETGTAYRSTNPQIATVESTGLVTAVSSGTAALLAINQGIVTSTLVQVGFDADGDGDGLPDDFENANAVDPGGANRARDAGVVVNASSSFSGFPAEQVADGSRQTSWQAAAPRAGSLLDRILGRFIRSMQHLLF